MLREHPAILLVEHGLGGGVDRHVQDLVTTLASRARFFLMRPERGGLLRVSRARDGSAAALYFDPLHETGALRQFLTSAGIERIHFHHALRLPWQMSLLPMEMGLPYDYTAHDYVSFCPQITLTSERFQYCGEPNEAGCKRCLAIRPSSTRESIQAWRIRYRSFVEGAARVFVPTPGVGERLSRHFPRARIVHAPHPEPLGSIKVTRPILKSSGPLRVAVLGALNPPKGADLLEQCALDAAVRKLPLTFHLLGDAYRRLVQTPQASLQVHGRYREADLANLLSGIAPDLIWFPAQWPETYSYTLSAAMRLGYPVAATDLGALADRLAGRESSWLLPWETNAEDWNNFFVRLRGASEERQYQAALRPALTPSVFSYEQDYVMGSAASLATPAAMDFSRYERAWRARPGFFVAAVKGALQERLRHVYRIRGVRDALTTIIPEYQWQRLRRWLDRY
jgi:O-antigen biosynthesis protein